MADGDDLDILVQMRAEVFAKSGGSTLHDFIMARVKKKPKTTYQTVCSEIAQATNLSAEDLADILAGKKPFVIDVEREKALIAILKPKSTTIADIKDAFDISNPLI